MLTITDRIKKAKECISKLTITSSESNAVLLVMAFQELAAAIDMAEAPSGGDDSGN